MKPRQARLMKELLPKVVVTPQTVTRAIESWNGEEPTSPPLPPRSSSERQRAVAPRGSPRSSSERERAVAPRGRGPRARPSVWLEVGFGGGEHLAWQAERSPGTLVIGAEPFVNGVAKLLSQVEERRLDNVRICHGDARPLMAALPDGLVDGLFVLHPDPWPKRKHHKRRIVNGPFLAEAARLLRPGAELRVASDIPDYVRWTLMQVAALNRGGRRFRWTAERQSDWLDRPSDWPQTRYEAKALREGRRPAYLSFERL